MLHHVQTCLVRYGVEYDLSYTQEPGHGVNLARQAATDGYERVVALGGDGTTNEAANGLLLAAEEGYQSSHGSNRCAIACRAVRLRRGLICRLSDTGRSRRCPGSGGRPTIPKTYGSSHGCSVSTVASFEANRGPPACNASARLRRPKPLRMTHSGIETGRGFDSRRLHRFEPCSGYSHRCCSSSAPSGRGSSPWSRTSPRCCWRSA